MPASLLLCASLLLGFAKACSTGSDVSSNKCPFEPCLTNSQCASGTCRWPDGDPTSGYCTLQGWLIAVIVVASIILFAIFVMVCICCCRCCKARRVKEELHIYNHHVDAQGRPLLNPPANSNIHYTQQLVNQQPAYNYNPNPNQLS